MGDQLAATDRFRHAMASAVVANGPVSSPIQAVPGPPASTRPGAGVRSTSSRACARASSASIPRPATRSPGSTAEQQQRRAARSASIDGLGAAMMPVTSDYWVAAAGLLLVGVGWSCVNVAVTALIADTVPAVERGRAVGVVDSFAGLASIVLPFTPAPRWRTTGEPSGRSSSCSATRRRPSARRWGTPIPTRSTGGWYATSAPSRRFQRDSKLPVLRRLGLLEEAQADERTGRCKKANTEAVWRSKRIVSRRQASIQALVRSTIQRCRPDRSLDSIRRRAIRGVMPPWRSTRRQNAKSAVLAVQLGWALARAARPGAEWVGRHRPTVPAAWSRARLRRQDAPDRRSVRADHPSYDQRAGGDWTGLRAAWPLHRLAGVEPSGHQLPQVYVQSNVGTRLHFAAPDLDASAASETT